MHRFSRLAIALLLVIPAAVRAQSRASIPDHWLTLETLTSRLSLSADQVAAVSEPYAALNAALLQAHNRRDELAAQHSGTRGVSQMSDAQRQALRDELAAISNEYAGRQRDVDNLLASIRAQLTPDQQASFDALEKPRALPAATQQSQQAKPQSQSVPMSHPTAPSR
jgi:hypothetical protein